MLARHIVLVRDYLTFKFGPSMASLLSNYSFRNELNVQAVMEPVIATLKHNVSPDTGSQSFLMQASRDFCTLACWIACCTHTS
jgi:hypothetical protein